MRDFLPGIVARARLRRRVALHSLTLSPHTSPSPCGIRFPSRDSYVTAHKNRTLDPREEYSKYIPRFPVPRCYPVSNTSAEKLARFVATPKLSRTSLLRNLFVCPR